MHDPRAPQATEFSVDTGDGSDPVKWSDVVKMLSTIPGLVQQVADLKQQLADQKQHLADQKKDAQVCVCELIAPDAYMGGRSGEGSRALLRHALVACGAVSGVPRSAGARRRRTRTHACTHCVNWPVSGCHGG